MNPFSPCMKRWVLAVAGLSAVQALLLHYGVVQVRSVRPVPPSGPQVSVVLGSGFDRSQNQLSLASPTLFALPAAEGFSGSGWLNRPSPVAIETSEDFPPSWLEMNTDSIGQALEPQIAMNRPGSTPVADLAVEWRDTFPADEPTSRSSRLWVEGDLKSRELLPFPSLPSWAHPDVPVDSHIAVIVDLEGWVQTAVMVEPEGEATQAVFGPRDRLLQADQFAQRFAQTLRFKPLRLKTPSAMMEEPTQWTSGRLIFRWGVLPPAPAPRGVLP
jgi:hypothetical protein